MRALQPLAPGLGQLGLLLGAGLGLRHGQQVGLGLGVDGTGARGARAIAA